MSQNKPNLPETPAATCPAEFFIVLLVDIIVLLMGIVVLLIFLPSCW